MIQQQETTQQIALPLAPKTRADQIFDRFIDFNRENPIVWELVEKYTFQLIQRGFKKYGIAGVIHKIRWDARCLDTGTGVKISNDFQAYYARLWSVAHPEHAEFYNLRKLTSSEVEAYGTDIPVMAIEPAVDEAELTARLKALLP